MAFEYDIRIHYIFNKYSCLCPLCSQVYYINIKLISRAIVVKFRYRFATFESWLYNNPVNLNNCGGVSVRDESVSNRPHLNITRYLMRYSLNDCHRKVSEGKLLTGVNLFAQHIVIAWLVLFFYFFFNFTLYLAYSR